MAKYKPGDVGNPNGRPKGTGIRQKLFNDSVLPHREALIARGLQMALEGDSRILTFFLERLLPPKPTDAAIENTIVLNGALSQQGNQVLGLITSGEVTLSEGTTLLHGLTAQAKLVETTELADKVDVINSTLKTRKRIKHESK